MEGLENLTAFRHLINSLGSTKTDVIESKVVLTQDKKRFDLDQLGTLARTSNIFCYKIFPKQEIFIVQ